MTEQEARERLEEIRGIAGDDEVAHSKEDEFHRDVLSLIATGCHNGQELARIAIQTSEIQFARWCA